MTLPESVRNLVELSPVEDVLLELLRDAMPDVRFQTLVEANQEFPFVLVRRSPHFGSWGGDPRFIDAADVQVHAFAAGLSADEHAALISEAVRVALRNAWLQNKTVPGRGHITSMEVTTPARRVSDWASAVGPVQYADLPTDVVRYEAGYRLHVRRPRTRPPI